MAEQIRALLFDVFGTVVDWRRSVASDLQDFFAPRGVQRDWHQFILGWRALYQPAMQAVRSGARPFVILDTLHRENLLQVLNEYDIKGLNDAELDYLTRTWHRLTPWPDVVEGLTRLKPHYELATCSNGNIALMENLARFGRLPWDRILGAEVTQSYKPDPKTYLGSAAALGLQPANCMMVAAHNEDLRAARALGLATAFVARPTEYGDGQTIDLIAEEDWDFATDGMTGLATLLGH